MPKNSVLGHPDNVPRLSREGFNVSQDFTFTASCGHLLPVWYDLVNPGETLKGSPSFLVRTENFLAPAMADVDIFCDVFFVPMQKILSAFGEWFYQINDLRSDLIDSDGFTEYLPLTFSNYDDKNPFAGFDRSIFDSSVSADLNNYDWHQRFENYGFGLHRLMSHFGYNPQSLFYSIWSFNRWQDETSQEGVLDDYKQMQYNVAMPNFCPYLFAAYQGIYFDYYRESEFENNDIKAYNLDSVFSDGSQQIQMDSLGPDGRAGLFEIRYRWRAKDYFTATRTTPLINSVSMLPNGVYHLNHVNQWLTSGDYYPMKPNGSISDEVLPENAATTYGIHLGGSASGNSGAPLFTRTGSTVKWAASDNAFSGNLKASSGMFSSEQDQNLRLENPHTHSINVATSATLSTARVRTMFALEKLAKVTQRAGKHYDDQTLAHFGFKVNMGLSGEVYKIKSYHTTLGIQKVTSTAATEGAALGEQAAVGYAVLDGRKQDFKFTAPCHGIVMAIWSCAPRYKYIGTIDKLGLKTRLWDFYKPELDNLGSQPVFAYERIFDAQADQPVSTIVEGWQWRFMESKVKFNRVAPVFATVGKNPWSMVARPKYPGFGAQVSPCDLNSLLNAQFQPDQPWPANGEQQDYRSWVGSYVTSYLRDPFVVDFSFKCSKVSTMSTFGDVSLNGI